MSEEFKVRLEVAIEAAHLASRYCEHIRQKSLYEDVTKQDGSPVTVADIGSQILISNCILKAFPDDLIVGEEDADFIELPFREEIDKFIAANNIHLVHSYERLLSKPVNQTESRPFWTVDPIDGTKGFLKKSDGQYAVCIAYIDSDGRPDVAVVACPRLRDKGLIVSAIRGQRYIMAAELTSDTTELEFTRVVPKNVQDNKLMCCSAVSNHVDEQVLNDLMSKFDLTPLRLDSQVKYVLTAMGDAKVYVRCPPNGYREKIWDHASGDLLVHEAGGCVLDENGQLLKYKLSGFLDCRMIISSLDCQLVLSMLELYVNQ